MPEPTTPVTPQAGGTGDTSPQAGNTTPSQPQAGGGTKTVEDYERMLADVRKEAASYRTKLKSFEEAEEAAKLAAMGDLDKANKKASDLEAKLQAQQQKLVDAQVRIAAQAKGVHPDALDLVALALAGKLDASADDFDKALDKAIDDLLTAKPMLKVSESGTRYAPATGANNPGRANTAQSGTTTVAGQKYTLADYYREKPRRP